LLATALDMEKEEIGKTLKEAKAKKKVPYT
jgi:hypothetical protein